MMISGSVSSGRASVSLPMIAMLPRDLDDEPERQADERRCAPAELGHRPDQEGAFFGWEEARRSEMIFGALAMTSFGNRIAVEAPVRTPCDERVKVHRPVEAHQPADAEQGEAEAELDAGVELDADDRDEREALRAVRHLRVDHADRRNREKIEDAELERARILAAIDVDEQVATALDDAGVDRQSDPVRRLEAKADVDRAEVAALAREREVRAQPDVLDDRGKRAKLRLEGGAEIDRQPVARHLDRYREALDLDRAQADMGRNLDLEGRCATEVEAARIVEADAEIELELGVEPRQDLRDEAVALRGVEEEASPSVSASANTSTSSPPTTRKPAAPLAETTSSRVPWLSPRIGNGVLSLRANSTSTRPSPWRAPVRRACRSRAPSRCRSPGGPSVLCRLAYRDRS